MRHVLLILSIILLYSCNEVFAQKYLPSQNALGVSTADLGSNIDHYTGSFNFRIPLSNKIADLEDLQLGLTYSSGGIRPEQAVGAYGYGWNLSGSFVVTRSVRGSLPDETFYVGFLSNPLGISTPDSTVKKINARDLDGEADLFTANIPGESVSFCLKRNGFNLVAVPVKRTDVKIECLYQPFVADSVGWIITGFKITDTDGDTYFFEEREIGLQKHGDGSKLNTYMLSTTTAWYITKVVKANKSVVDFEYGRYYMETQFSLSQSYSVYGEPMKYSDINNNMVLSQIYAYENSIRDAQRGLDILDNQYAFELGLLDDFSTVMEKNPFTEIREETKEEDLRLQSFFSSVLESQLVYERNRLNARFDQKEVEGDIVIDGYLSNIAILSQTLMTNTIDVSQESNAGSQCVYRKYKLLNRIRYRDGEVNFKYIRVFDHVSEYSPRLVQLENKSSSGALIGYHDLVYNNDSKLLKKLVSRDEVGRELASHSFQYYLEGGGSPGLYSLDFWGYYNGEENNQGLISSQLHDVHSLSDPNVSAFYNPTFSRNFLDAPFEDVKAINRNPNDSFAVLYSLKTIALPTKGRIDLKYESHQVYDGHNDATIKVGGLRIKEFTFADSLGASQTTRLRYAFPKGGSPLINKSTGVYSRLKRKAFFNIYDYGTNSDCTLYSSPIDLDGAFSFNYNPEVFYTYVESTDSVGFTGYKFYNPAGSANDILANRKSISWLNNLPLATYYFNKSHELLSLDRSEYYYSEEDAKADDNMNTPWLPASLDYYKGKGLYFFNDNRLASNYHLNQIKSPLNYYSGDKYLKAFPDSNVIVSEYVSAYNTYQVIVNLRLQYLYPNITPRVLPYYDPVDSYKLHLGGTVLLRAKESVRFQTPKQMPAVTPLDYEFLMDEVEGASTDKLTARQVLKYESNLHLNPTLSYSFGSKNDTAYTTMRYALDYSLTADQPVSRLWSVFHQNPLVEKMSWRKVIGASDPSAVQGVVTDFQYYISLGDTVVLPVRSYSFEQKSPGAVNVAYAAKTAIKDNGRFNYTLEQSNDWQTQPWGISMKSKTAERNRLSSSLIRDQITGMPIMELSGLATSLSAGIDLSAIKSARQFAWMPFAEEISTSLPISDQFVTAWDKMPWIRPIEMAERFNSFIATNPWGLIWEDPYFLSWVNLFDIMANDYDYASVSSLLNAIMEYEDLFGPYYNEAIQTAYPDADQFLRLVGTYVYKLALFNESATSMSENVSGLAFEKYFLRKDSTFQLDANARYPLLIEGADLKMQKKMKILSLGECTTVYYQYRYAGGSWSAAAAVSLFLGANGNYETELDLSSIISGGVLDGLKVLIPKTGLQMSNGFFVYPAANVPVIYERNNKDQITKAHLVNGEMQTFDYHSSGYLSTVKDRAGNIVKQIKQNLVYEDLNIPYAQVKIDNLYFNSRVAVSSVLFRNTTTNEVQQIPGSVLVNHKRMANIPAATYEASFIGSGPFKVKFVIGNGLFDVYTSVYNAFSQEHKVTIALKVFSANNSYEFLIVNPD